MAIPGAEEVLPEGSGPYGNQYYQTEAGKAYLGNAVNGFVGVQREDEKDALGGYPSIENVSLNTTIAKLRLLEGALKSPVLYSTDKGKEGIWIYDFQDTTSVDDGANVLVTVDGKRLKRPKENAVKAWHYGLKGDGITDDTVPFQNMLNSISSNTTIDFGGRDYQFDIVNLVGRRFITFKGDGATFRGVPIIGETDPMAPVYEYNFRSIGIRFLGSGFVNNGYELCNIRGFYVQNTHVTGINAAIYVRPINKFQHVNRGFIQGTSGGSNYLFYADNPINVAPYTNIQMTTGDVEIAGNADQRARIANVVGFGVDGITMTSNTFFMPNYAERSQIKKQNVRLVAANWITMIGCKLFESGEEGALFEKCRNWIISGCEFAWNGQKDIYKSFGFRLTGGGYTDINYTTGIISNCIFDRIPGTDIKIEAQSTGVTIHSNRHSATGNPSMFYGDGTFPAGDPNVTPSINSVPHYAIDVDANTKRILVHNNFSDNVDFNFGFDESLNLSDLDLLRHWNNIGRNGVAESRTKTLASIPVTGTVDTGGTNNIILNVASGVIKNFSNAHVGDVIMIYNAHNTGLTIENNIEIQIADNINIVVPLRGTITFQKRLDKWYEVSKTFAGVFNPQIFNINGAAGTNRDLNFQTAGQPRWIVRTNDAAENTDQKGSDLEVIARNNNGSILGYVLKFFRYSRNMSVGDVSDIPSAQLSVNSVTKGFLPPRMNTTQRDAIVSPANGLMIANTTTGVYETCNGSVWRPIKVITTNVDGATQNMSGMYNYITNNSARIDFNMLDDPSYIIGDIISIRGRSFGGWKINQSIDMVIHTPSGDTTPGVSGYIQSGGRYDFVKIEKINTNEWTLVEGSITLNIF